MIPKGSQRGGGQQLATHLLNEFDNDRVELVHVRGAVSRDLHGAFAEWRAISRATQCRKYLYSLSLNPDPRQGPLTREQYIDFINRTENRIGLAGQPRAVVFHVKHGREHCHVVWSRVDERTLKALQISHDHQNLRTIAREFARDHGLQLPTSMVRNRGAARFADRLKRESLREQQQQERSGITKQERMAALATAWKESRDGPTLVAALERSGYLLARGDRRAYVVVDRAGEIHALARQLADVRTKQVKARLADYPLEKLPDAHKAQEFLRAKERQREAREAKERGPAAPLAFEQQSPRQRREELSQRHAHRRAALAAQKAAIEKAHGIERDTLHEEQSRETLGVKTARARTKAGPVLSFLMRITGFGRVIAGVRQRQDEQRTRAHGAQREKLERRHTRELVDFRHRAHALASIEARERRSLETQIRRESFERSVQRERGGMERDGRPPPRGLSSSFARAARSPSARPRTRLTPSFTDAAARSPPFTKRRARATPEPRRLHEAFTSSAEQGLWTRVVTASSRTAHRLAGMLSRLFHRAAGVPAFMADDVAPRGRPNLGAAFRKAACGPIAQLAKTRSGGWRDILARAAAQERDDPPAPLTPAERTAPPALEASKDGLSAIFAAPAPEVTDAPAGESAPVADGLSASFARAAIPPAAADVEMRRALLDQFRRSASGDTTAPRRRTRGARGMRPGPSP